jgi:hypothetical protein
MYILKNKFMYVLAFMFLLTIFVNITADEVEDFIEKGRKAYLQEDYKQAHQMLQKAVAAISENISAAFTPFLPAAPSGWQKGEVETNTTSMPTAEGDVRVTEAGCEYKKSESDEEVEIYFTNSPQIVQPYQQMAARSDMMKGIMKQRGLEVNEKDGWFIVIEKRGEADHELTAVQQAVAIKIQRAPNQETAQLFFDAIDLNGLLQAAKQ